MNQTIRSIALFLVFATLTTMALGVIPKVTAGGPLTPNMLIRIYNDPTQEEAALATGDIDMNDWSLSSTFITAHATDPAITLNEVAEIGEMEFDINDQLWPTGPTVTPRSGVKNVFMDPVGVRDIAALHFRRALAHLTNKDKYTTTFMGGYGYVMQTIIPVPALEGFTDYSTLSNATAVADAGVGGYLYPYDRAAAIAELEAGGFHDWDGDTWREWKNPGTGAVEELPNMKFWIRLDDPNRRQAGEDLYSEMVAVGIPEAASAGGAGLDKRISERSTCFTQVMVLYDYNIYTGGWSLTADPDFIFDFFHSSMGQYSYANNYPGFKSHEFDAYAEKVKYPLTLADVRNAAIQAQWILNKYVATIWLWASKTVKGYRTGWEGVVNMAGFGTDQQWSFQQMNWIDGAGTSRLGPLNTIVYGFKSDISALQVVTSEWLWDWNVLNLMYDTMLLRNPYNLPNEVGTLATSWGSTNNYPGWEGKTVVEFTMRTDAKFHDGTPVKPADYAYSILMVKAAGAGAAWNYPSVMDVDKIEIQGNLIRVYFGVSSAFAVHWAGMVVPVINKDLWDDAIGAGTTAGYTGFIPDDSNGVYTPGTYADAAAIRAYHPWESTAAGDPAKNDLSEDGSNIYRFVSYAVGNNVALSAFADMYTTVTWNGQTISFANFIPKAFHGIGNVNYNGGYGQGQGWYTADQKIDLAGDLTKIATSAPSTIGGPWGPGQTQYNPDADINGDGAVNVIDLATAGTNYNKKQG